MKKKIFVSKKAQKHSSKGSFAYSKDGKREYKMIGGGHGQDNINFLKSRKIPNRVVFEYDNGVRGEMFQFIGAQTTESETHNVGFRNPGPKMT